MRLAAAVVVAGSTLAAAAAARAGEAGARRAYSRTISLGAGAC
jgi:hypothetical protein